MTKRLDISAKKKNPMRERMSNCVADRRFVISGLKLIAYSYVKDQMRWSHQIRKLQEISIVFKKQII